MPDWLGAVLPAEGEFPVPVLAAQVLEDPAHAETASRAADFLLSRMRTPDGRLLRTYGAGSEAKLNGYLEDYAFLINALVMLPYAFAKQGWMLAPAFAANGLVIAGADLATQRLWKTAAA